MTVLLATAVSGCGGGGGGVAAPTTIAVPTVPGAGTGLGGLGSGPAPVVLGAAGNYVILAKSAYHHRSDLRDYRQYWLESGRRDFHHWFYIDQ